MKQHCATGKPKGRPRLITRNFREKVMASLRKRIDVSTGLIKPDWSGIARELGVSRSTVARQMQVLHQCSIIESVYIPITEKTNDIYYRLHESFSNDTKPAENKGK